MNLLEEWARHLAFLGFGTVAGPEEDGCIFYGRLPEREGLTVCVMAADAGSPGSPARLQVMVRADSDREAFETCDRIARETDGFEGYLMGWGRRASVRVLNGAHGLGADARRRALYACSLQVRCCGE